MWKPRRIAIVFSGGPAPAANAVIAAAASSFRRNGCEVLGFRYGYSALENYDPTEFPLLEGRDYFVFSDSDLRGLRNARGVLIGTARTNPGRMIRGTADLSDPLRSEPLRRVHQALRALGVEALVSIGGDDTLKTANLFSLVQEHADETNLGRVRVVHIPKTIDNDYRGIDFTFGFFTAVDVMAKELLNLRADAMATRSYFVVETMGRKAGWLAYGVAAAGEAHLVVGVEDVIGTLAAEETVVAEDGTRRTQTCLNLEALAELIVDLILLREERGKGYGTVVLAEGLAEMLPASYLSSIGRDEHGHVSLGKVDLGKLCASLAAERYRARTGRDKKLTGIQLGYESRCEAPHAFDVILGSQLGLGAYRALVEKGLDRVMISVAGQLELQYVPFGELVNPQTLKTEIRFIRPGSDFHRLARELETRVKRP